jgi:hypothetical protein
LQIGGACVCFAVMHALEVLRPVSPAYAAMPVADAFTWQDVAGAIEPGEWYMVAFRSVRREGADEAVLNLYDDWAEQEASLAPGFVHYFKGPLGIDRSCLSFCLWTSRTEARAAAAMPKHRNAVTLTGVAYETYRLEFHRVTKRDGTPSLEFEPWDAPAPVESPASPASAAGLRPVTSSAGL